MNYKGKVRFWQSGKNDKITPKCASILFRNTGETRLRINEIWPLEPGEETPPIAMIFPNVIDETEYRITFDPGGTKPQVTAMILDISPTNQSNGSDLLCEKL